MYKVYIGAKFKNADKVNQLTEVMKKHGMVNQYNWAENIKDDETKEEMLAAAVAEKNAIEKSNSVIFLLPLGKGSHIELGIALAHNKDIYLCSNDEEDFKSNTTNFYELQNITKITGTDEEITQKLISKIKKRSIEHIR